MSAPLHVAVIGAGIVGACSAWELLKDGHRITFIEPGTPGGEQAASYGNGAWLSPSSVVPMSMPGLWKKVPGYLLDQSGPLTIRPRDLPALTPWLIRFMRAGSTVARVETTARALSALLHDAPARHAALAAEIGRPELVVQNGLLYAYPSRTEFEGEALAWRLRRDNGVMWQELDRSDLAQLVPDLGPSYQFGAYVRAGAHCANPGHYVAAIVAACQRRGAVIAPRTATGFVLQAGRLRAVRTDEGDISCDRAVIAAGIRSAALARAAGDLIPLAAERGYHVVIPKPGIHLPVPVMPSDGKMANTSTDTGFRASGQVELAHPDAPPNWRRAEILLERALAAYPKMAEGLDRSTVKRWMGHRPSTPDGLPVLGPASGCADVLHAYGHGHVGLAAGAVSGRVVADLLGGGPISVPIQALAPARFGRTQSCN